MSTTATLIITRGFFSLMTFLGEINELYLQYGNFLEKLIPTLNKVTEKCFHVKMQSITEQLIFVVKTYYKTSWYLEV